MAGAVVGQAHPDFPAAREAMSGIKPRVFQPNAAAHQVYRQLFRLYGKLHDAFGVRSWQGSLDDVMKQLIDIRDESRK